YDCRRDERRATALSARGGERDPRGLCQRRDDRFFDKRKRCAPRPVVDDVALGYLPDLRAEEDLTAVYDRRRPQQVLGLTPADAPQRLLRVNSPRSVPCNPGAYDNGWTEVVARPSPCHRGAR